MIPALLDGGSTPRNVIVPSEIVLYHKSKARRVNPLPRGLHMLAGNIAAGGVAGTTFTPRYEPFWSCGNSGAIYNADQPRIPTNCDRDGVPPPPEVRITATIRFPQCLSVDGNGAPCCRRPTT